MAISRESVVWAYQLFQGMAPPEAVINDKTKLASSARLVFDLLSHSSSSPGSAFAGWRTTEVPPVVSTGWSSDSQVVGDHRTAVIWAYRLILGREPESEAVVRDKMETRNRIDLLDGFLSSHEFRERSKNWRNDYERGGDLPPLPPLHLRKSVGPVEKEFWENPSGDLIFGAEVPDGSYASVFDFGCGCGRTARQMMQQLHAPSVYLGVDLNREAIAWCTDHLVPIWRNCQFQHLDVYNPNLNPNSHTSKVQFPTYQKYLLVNAHSVFTHITEEYLDHYLGECVRVLDSNGVFRATWFLFDKVGFPMMQEFQNCLYINPGDPTNATIYDYDFVQRKYAQHGLAISKIVSPVVRGFQWVLVASHEANVTAKAQFPEDTAPTGVVRPPY